MTRPSDRQAGRQARSTAKARASGRMGGMRLAYPQAINQCGTSWWSGVGLAKL